ncbi:MAG TPA: hypothetical protein VEP90_06890 [Methylomirabilota bacterium]|nr:hypothetical protein [Methylomirabilota bacterium]
MEVNAAFGLVKEKQMNGIILIVATSYDTNKMPPLWRQLHRYDATKNYQTALMGVLKALELRQ